MVNHKHYTIMENEKKKHKGGYELLQEKYAKLKAENEELREIKSKYDEFRKQVENPSKSWKTLAENRQKEISKLQTTIEQQSRKISQLTADLHSSETLRLNSDAAHSKKEGKMLRAMGPIRRWWWNLHHLPTFKEDERWNETH